MFDRIFGVLRKVGPQTNGQQKGKGKRHDIDALAKQESSTQSFKEKLWKTSQYSRVDIC